MVAKPKSFPNVIVIDILPPVMFISNGKLQLLSFTDPLYPTGVIVIEGKIPMRKNLKICMYRSISVVVNTHFQPNFPTCKIVRLPKFYSVPRSTKHRLDLVYQNTFRVVWKEVGIVGTIVRKKWQPVTYQMHHPFTVNE